MKRMTSIMLMAAFVAPLACAADAARAEDKPAQTWLAFGEELQPPVDKSCQSGPATKPAPTTEPAAPAAAIAWPPGLLMDGLNQAGAKDFFDATGVRVWGSVEAGFMGRLTGGQKYLPGRLMDTRRVDELNLSELRMTLDRPYDSAKSFDIGGRADVLYGGDAFFTHAQGLDEMGSGGGDNWFDPMQFYAQPWFKTGPDSGFEFTVGRFWGTCGYEAIDAALSPLYSHSYLFNTMGPFTVTGVESKYIFNKEWYAYFAIVNGWDDFHDNNQAHSYIAGGCWSSADQIDGHSSSCVTLNVMTGPEQPGNVTNNRTLVDGSFTHWWTGKFSEAIAADWQTEEDASPTGGPARSYGLAHYLTYIFNDYFTGIWRAEWFRDDSGVRLGEIPASWYEMTWGVNVTPCPYDKILKNLVLRPEFRWDFADEPVFGGGRENQLTLGIDAVFKF